MAPSNKAVVVGRDNDGKCLVAFFDPVLAQWQVVGCFPSITGILWSCYSDGLNNLWVCGGTGALGKTSPILRHWNGIEWENYDSVISDAVVFYRIDGNSSNNIWVTGEATGGITDGAWNWNGVSWTSTKVNTISIGYANGMSVSAEGHCYQVDNKGFLGSGQQIFSNRTVPGFASVAAFGTFGVKAVRDDAVFATRNSGIRIAKYVSSWLTAESGQSSEIVGAYDEDHYTYVESISPGGTVYKKGNVAISAAGTVLSTIGPNHGGVCYLDDADDIWYCTIKWSGTWSSVPQLTHYEGGTTWSVPTDYNVNGLNAHAWYDIKGVDPDFSFSSLTPENDAVAVGQDNSGNCLVATFSPLIWTRRTEFPTIAGHLFSVCAPYKNKFWVCGGTGALGQTSPVLYYWDGSVFIDHSSALTDAVSLWSIRCQGPDNIWVVGKATGALDHGAWHWDGVYWTPTKVNTIVVGRGDLANSMFCSVSAEGNCYISSWMGGTEQKVFTNLAVPGFAEMFYCNTICGTNPIYATADDQIRVSLGNGGFASQKYNGISWTYEGNYSTSCLGVLDFFNWFWVPADGTGQLKTSSSAQTKIGNVQELSSTLAGRSFTARIDGRPDIWLANSKYDYGRWAGSGIAQLTYWKGCTDWSGPTEFGVAALDADRWHDLASSMLEPPVPPSPYVSPCFTGPLNTLEQAILDPFIHANTTLQATERLRRLLIQVAVSTPDPIAAMRSLYLRMYQSDLATMTRRLIAAPTNTELASFVCYKRTMLAMDRDIVQWPYLYEQSLDELHMFGLPDEYYMLLKRYLQTGQAHDRVPVAILMIFLAKVLENNELTS